MNVRRTRAVGRRGRLTDEGGQVLSEYLTILGFMVGTVIACMAMFVSPVATAYLRLFRRLVLYLTGTQ